MERSLDVLTNSILIMYIMVEQIARIFLLEYVTSLLAGKLWVMVSAEEKFFGPNQVC
jgi:hypothetical protein